MIFTSPYHAQQFLVDKIISQARIEDTPLSEDDIYMLSLSFNTRETPADEAHIDAFLKKTTTEKFQEKISHLLRNAYKSDTSKHPEMKNEYRKAYRVLKKNNYYLSILLEDVLGSKIKKWGTYALTFGVITLAYIAFRILLDRALKPIEDKYPDLPWLIGILVIGLLYYMSWRRYKAGEKRRAVLDFVLWSLFLVIYLLAIASHFLS